MVNANVPAVKINMPRLTNLACRERHTAMLKIIACWKLDLFFEKMRFEDYCDQRG
jgi:hypothetical protein